MTGQHADHTHIRGNGSDMVDKPYPVNRVPLRDEDSTAAQVLKKAGYVTGIILNRASGRLSGENIGRQSGMV